MLVKSKKAMVTVILGLVKSVPLTTNYLSLGTDFSLGIYSLKVDDKNVGKVVKVK